MTKEEFIDKYFKQVVMNEPFVTFEIELNRLIQQAIAEHEASQWKKYPENKPEVGIEVLGQSTAWIDEDYNPKGIRLCFWDDLVGWISARWNNTYDCYDAIEEESPEKWRHINF